MRLIPPCARSPIPHTSTVQEIALERESVAQVGNSNSDRNEPGVGFLRRWETLLKLELTPIRLDHPLKNCLAVTGGYILPYIPLSEHTATLPMLECTRTRHHSRLAFGISPRSGARNELGVSLSTG